MIEQRTRKVGEAYKKAVEEAHLHRPAHWARGESETPQEDEQPKVPLVREITAADFERNAKLIDMSGYRPYRQSLLTLIATQLVPSARASDVIIAQPKSYSGLRVGIGGRYFELHCEDVTPALAGPSLDNDLLTWFDAFIANQVTSNPSE